MQRAANVRESIDYNDERDVLPSEQLINLLIFSYRLFQFLWYILYNNKYLKIIFNKYFI